MKIIITSKIASHEFDNIKYALAYIEGACGGKTELYRFYEHYIKGGCKLIDTRSWNGLMIETIGDDYVEES